MKRTMLSLASLSLAFTAPIAVSAPAAAEPATGTVQYCKEIIGSYPGHSLGECVAYFESDPQAAAAMFCIFLEREDALDDFGYDSVGECVTDLNAS